MSDIELNDAQEKEFDRQWEILNFGVKPIGQSGEIIQAVNLNYILNKISFVD